MLSAFVESDIYNDMDVVKVRKIVRDYTVDLKFNLVDQTKLITAVSEIARNTLIYGGGGKFILEVLNDAFRPGLKLSFIDQGPGIADVEKALTDGYTSGSGMGLGLGGSKRLVDEFEIDTTPGKGTRITLIKRK